MIHESDNSAQALISSAQTLTNAFADLGSVIDTRDMGQMALWLKVDINDSQNVEIKILCSDTPEFTDAYYLPVEVLTATKWLTTPQIYQLDVDADQNIVIPVELNDCFPYVKVQVQALVAGASPGSILAAKVTMNSNQAAARN